MRIILICFLSFLFVTSYSQEQIYYLHSHQPQEIKAFAGSDTQINQGDSVVLGETPSAQYGYGNYIFSWSPESGLNNASLANPTAKPDITTTYTLLVWDGSNCSASDEVVITVGTTSSENRESIQSISIYPNPTNYSFHIGLEGFTGRILMKIVNNLGQTVINKEYNVTNSFHTEVDIQSLHKGYYFIIFQNSTETLTKPLVIN